MITGVAAVLVLVAGLVVLAVGPGQTTVRTTSVAASRHSGTSGAKATPKPVTPAPAIEVASFTPRSGAGTVNGTSPITVGFSAPLSASTPLPKISPDTAGSWKISGSTATFTPSVGWPEEHQGDGDGPGRYVRHAVQGRDGEERWRLPRGRVHPQLHHRHVLHAAARAVAGPAQLPAAELDRQPGPRSRGRTTAAQIAAAYDPPSGSFSWDSGYPSALHSFWSEGSANLIVTGAIRSFEDQHNLTMDGEAGPTVWADLMKDVAAGHDNGNGYTYALASKSSPETLTIWHDGKQSLQTRPTPASRRPRPRTAPSRSTRSCRSRS